jgi:hypothetical protein
VPSTPKTTISAVVLMPPAISIPRTAPAAIPGPQRRRIATSTAPFLACALTERWEVKTMVASENAGTSTMPPPTPRSPAITPASAPITTSIAASGRSCARSGSTMAGFRRGRRPA